MKPREVVWAWGLPNDIHESVSVLGRMEQWVYSSRYARNYVHFHNGEVGYISNL